MSEEKGKDIYIVNDDSKIDFEKSGHDFDIMPEEFFNSKYQQSRVKKEQQMQKEKELIDKKKIEKVEKLNKLSELEKQRKEKDELKKERERIRESERMKKQEELDFINKKKKERQEKINEENEIANKVKQEALDRKMEKERKIKDLNQKAKKERKLLKKEQEEILKEELEKRAAFLRSQNYGTDENQKNKEVEKALASERAGILKKIKFEQKLNAKDQNRIRKEIKEEEKQKFEKARQEAEAQAKLALGNSSKKYLNLDFADDERLSKIENKKMKKQKIIIFVYSSIGVVFVMFMLIQTKVIDLNKKQNINNIDNVVTEDQPKLTDLPVIVEVPVVVDDSKPNFDSVLNYNYKYKFSRFVDFFKYGIDNNNSYGYISNKEKNLYGATIGRTDDSDNDSYLDGEEIMNLYDPAIKTDGQSLDLKLFESGKVTPYKFNSIEFYYPTQFVEPFNLQESIVIAPEDTSKEYVSFTILKNVENLSFVDFLNTQESSTDFYRIGNFSDTIENDFYINNLGNSAYLDIGNNEILRVSYVVESKNITNYIATYLMILKSVVVKQ